MEDWGTKECGHLTLQIGDDNLSLEKSLISRTEACLEL